MRKKLPTKQTNASRSGRNRIIVEFPDDLLSEADRAVAELKLNRSTFIRNSVQDALARLRRAKFEAELAEGYREQAELNRRICEEFKYVDAENID